VREGQGHPTPWEYCHSAWREPMEWLRGLFSRNRSTHLLSRLDPILCDGCMAPNGSTQPSSNVVHQAVLFNHSREVKSFGSGLSPGNAELTPTLASDASESSNFVDSAQSARHSKTLSSTEPATCIEKSAADVERMLASPARPVTFAGEDLFALLLAPQKDKPMGEVEEGGRGLSLDQALQIQGKALAAMEELMSVLEIVGGMNGSDEHSRIEESVRLSVEAIGMNIYVPMHRQFPR